MSTFKFLHAADIHLDSPLRGLETYPDAPVEEIRNASRRALDNLVDLALQQKAAFVLLAGDIYDGEWKDYNTSLFFAQRMGRLLEADINVFMVSGNHDAASVIARNLRPPDNVYIFPGNKPVSREIDQLGVVIHGQSYQTRETMEDLAASFPPAMPGVINIGILHSALSGRPGHDTYAPTNLDVLKSKGYDYWALGHIHQREEVSNNPWVVFPGNLQGRHIRESGAKGCTVVEVDEKRISRVTHHDLDVLRWQQCRVDLGECETSDDFLRKIRNSLQSCKDANRNLPLAVRLILEGKTPLHNWLQENAAHIRQECRAMAAGLGLIWLERIKVTTKADNDTLDELDAASPLAGLINSIKGLSLEANLEEQIPELATLQTKLPPEMKAEEEVLDLNNPAYLHELRENARELLLAHLLGKGEEK
ncbi:MAG: DNA repair exonuclease [Desulfobacteraceae bacterium]